MSIDANAGLSRRRYVAAAAALPLTALAGKAAAVEAQPAAGKKILRLGWAGIRLEVGDVSLFVDGGGRRIIHCGDTAWHSGWWTTARAYGPFDVAFLPINGFRQQAGLFRRIEQPMSLTPEQAVQAGRILGARQVVPIHYGNSGNPDYVEERSAPV